MASISDVSYENVYLGPWTDKSKGAISGATITVTSTNGAILIALIAVFIQMSGHHQWGIICFIWHQIRVSHDPKTGLKWQQDVSLRNNGSPRQNLWQFVQIAWAWRHIRKGSGQWWRVAALPISTPLLFQLMILGAGILSSRIVETSNIRVLLRGDNCGIWKIPTQEVYDTAASQWANENGLYARKVNEFSRIYARGCYNKTNAHLSPTCQVFTKVAIPYTTSLNASCPFDSSTCIYNNTNLRFDTGKMDVNHMLGINSNTDNLKFRIGTTCSPIKQEIYTSRRNMSGCVIKDKNAFRMYWNWGSQRGADQDYVYFVNYIGLRGHRSFTVDSIEYYPMDARLDIPDQSEVIPNEQFMRTDGDTRFLFLQANDFQFKAPCDDPWFSAHEAWSNPMRQNQTSYSADYVASPIGCVDQYQFCVKRKDGESCTLLAGIIPAAAEAKYNLSLSAMQSVLVDLFINAIYLVRTNIGQPNQREASLLASESSESGWLQPIPDNQWVAELHDTQNRVLAMLQRVIIDYAQGPGFSSAQELIEVPDSPEAKALCGMIRAKTNGKFSNVNTYGLSVILLLGTLIMLINTSLLNIVMFFRKGRKTKSFKTDSWIANGLFQIQRALFEAYGHEPWQNIKKGVPVMKNFEPISMRRKHSRTFMTGETTASPITSLQEDRPSSSISPHLVNMSQQTSEKTAEHASAENVEAQSQSQSQLQPFSNQGSRPVQHDSNLSLPGSSIAPMQKQAFDEDADLTKTDDIEALSQPPLLTPLQSREAGTTIESCKARFEAPKRE